MSTLFEETNLKNVTLRNRLVRSATWEGMCDEQGRVTPKLVEWYRALAQGGVGLIITGYACVRKDGIQMCGMMSAYRDDFATGHRQVVDAVHENGAKIFMQIVHAGGQGMSLYSGEPTVAPSVVDVEQYSEQPQELTMEQIGEIIQAFADAAARAKAWGYDGVELHGAHGYLISQFLSPLTNKRTDVYGGSQENRRRFLVETYKAVRRAVGDDFPVCVKLNAADHLEGGMDFEDGLAAAKVLDQAGVDAIEVSGGTPASREESPARSKINAPEKEAYHLEYALKYKQELDCPIICVGGFRSYEIAEHAVRKGMDFISMARPLIREPDLPNRWAKGEHDTAACISCNGCFVPGIKEGGIYCIVDKKEKEKQD